MHATRIILMINFSFNTRLVLVMYIKNDKIKSLAYYTNFTEKWDIIIQIN